jgi:hypothetical protein
MHTSLRKLQKDIAQMESTAHCPSTDEETKNLLRSLIENAKQTLANLIETYRLIGYDSPTK